MKVERVASEVYSALKTGRDAVTPGFFNKVYSHIVVKWLPLPALALLSKVSMIKIMVVSVVVLIVVVIVLIEVMMIKYIFVL